MGIINKTVLATGIVALTTFNLSATEQRLEVEAFTGVSVGTGMISNVTCGADNTVNLTGDKKVLDDIVVEIKSGVLKVHRSESAGSLISKFFNNSSKDTGSVKVDIVTNGQIDDISTSTGASMSVTDCAINSSYLNVDTSTGSSVSVEGFTAQLTLDMSTGSAFNRRTTQFTVGTVELDMSTGATANLCGATTITGDASTGAVISVGSTTDAQGVDLSIGADTSSRRCR